MELEPGLIEREPMPFGRRVSYDGLFEGLADSLVGVLGDSDGGLASVINAVGEDGPRDLDTAYDRTIGVASELHESELAGGSQSAAPRLLGAGGNVDTLHGAVVRYLPSPDAPLDTTFIDPPDTSVIHTGRGFDTIDAAPPGEGPAHPPPGSGGGEKPPTVRQQVRALYLELLGREPDADGWQGWIDAIEIGGWTLAQVRQAFLDSDEYHDRHPG